MSERLSAEDPLAQQMAQLREELRLANEAIARATREARAATSAARPAFGPWWSVDTPQSPQTKLEAGAGGFHASQETTLWFNVVLSRLAPVLLLQIDDSREVIHIPIQLTHTETGWIEFSRRLFGTVPPKFRATRLYLASDRFQPPPASIRVLRPPSWGGCEGA